MDSRTQLLYKAGELGALGYGSGVITAIGFNVHSNNPQVMNGFQIKMKNTTTTALSGTFETGTTFAYSGTYAVSGTGWQMITLQTPFSWNGSNLLIEICFDNSSYTLNTTVTASSVPSLAQHYMEDLQSASGCAMTNCFLESFRPDITLTFSSPVPATCAPLVVDHLAGNVAPVYKTGNYSTITYLPGEPTKCWITRNLGASQQPAAVNDTAEASAGWYWQFNRKQGFKHDGVTRTPGTNWIIYIDENSNWLAANDPCNLLLGSSWRIPTSTEWNNVDNAGNWTNWNSAWESGLKLHAAGQLSITVGTIFFRGAYGYYASSTQSDMQQNFELYFNSSNCGTMADYKLYGLPIRCLRVN